MKELCSVFVVTYDFLCTEMPLTAFKMLQLINTENKDFMYFNNCLQNTRLISNTYMLYTGVYREHQCIKLQAVYRTCICCISVIYLVLYCHASVCVIKSPKPAVIKYENTC